jgi:hypothetical protein
MSKNCVQCGFKLGFRYLLNIFPYAFHFNYGNDIDKLIYCFDCANNRQCQKCNKLIPISCQHSINGRLLCDDCYSNVAVVKKQNNPFRERIVSLSDKELVNLHNDNNIIEKQDDNCKLLIEELNNRGGLLKLKKRIDDKEKNRIIIDNLVENALKTGTIYFPATDSITLNYLKTCINCNAKNTTYRFYIPIWQRKIVSSKLGSFIGASLGAVGSVIGGTLWGGKQNGFELFICDKCFNNLSIENKNQLLSIEKSHKTQNIDNAYINCSIINNVASISIKNAQLFKEFVLLNKAKAIKNS